MTPSRADGRTLVVACALAATVVLAYAPVVHFEFIGFDDPLYVTANPRVQAGLTADGVRWAFGAAHAANWHPLTWLSHMLDVELFGLRPGGHHASNVALHLLNSLVLLALLAEATGEVWAPAFVAAVFALHPLHVESVAWVSERKDVLSACFFLLALLAYVRGVRRSTTGVTMPVVVLFGLACLAKPMVVTLPIVLLLLDYWPLARLSSVPSRRELLARTMEKTPLFVVAGALAVTTFLAQRSGGAVVTLDRLPVGQRVVNAAVAWVEYVWSTLWPVGLAVFYPYRSWSIAAGVTSAVVLAAVSVGVIVAVRRVPALLVGWLWYLVMLLPVVGLVQVGSHSIADRFTYLPQTGLAIMAAWGVRAVLPRRWGAGLAVVVALACLALTMRQVQYWRDDETLFRRALAVTEGNYLAHNSLGVALARREAFDEARAHYAEAVRLNPQHAESHLNLGNALARAHETEAATRQYEEALRLRPDLPEVYNAFGRLLMDTGKLDQAGEHYRRAVELRPEYAEARLGLGTTLRLQGRCPEAAAHYYEVSRLRPDWAEPHYGLGVCLAASGEKVAAEQELRQSIRLAPTWFPPAEALAWLLATSGSDRAGEAVALAEAARARAGADDPHLLDTLAMAYAAAGRFQEASDAARQSVALARGAGNDRLADEVAARLAAYEQGRIPERLP